MKFTRIALKKINEMLDRYDSHGIDSIEDGKVRIKFSDRTCAVDGVGLVTWQLITKRSNET